MLEKGFLLIVALVGGYASVTGTLPAALIALFGNPQALGSSSTSVGSQIEQALGEAIGQSLGTGLAGPIGGAIGQAVGKTGAPQT